MGFWSGFAQTFKPAEIVNTAVGLLEERRKEQRKIDEEIKEQQKQQMQSLLMFDTFAKSLDQYKPLPEGEKAGIPFANISGIKQIIEDAYKSGTFIDPNVANVVVSNLSKIAEKSYEDYVERVGELKPDINVVGHFTDAQNRVVALIEDDKTGSIYAQVVTDKNGKPIIKKDTGERENVKKAQEDLKKYLSDATAISSLTEIGGEARQQYIAKLLSDSAEFFLDFPQYKKYYNHQVVTEFIDRIKQSASKHRVVKIQDIERELAKISDLNERGVLTYALLNRLLAQGYQIGGLEAPTIKLK